MSRDEYSSEFEPDSETESRKKRRLEISGSESRLSNEKPAKPKRSSYCDQATGEAAKIDRYHFISKDAYSRHKELVNNYLLYYGGKWSDFQPKRPETYVTDRDIIRENSKFLWTSSDSEEIWGQKLAKRYWDKLYKEYAIADLSRYRENKIALRWRVEKEVISGKGQFTCGNKKCSETAHLKSWEVNFAYSENGVSKNALVKLRLCQSCSKKLNYHHQKRLASGKPATATERSIADTSKAPNSEQFASNTEDLLSHKRDSQLKVQEGSQTIDLTKKTIDKASAREENTHDDNVWKRPVVLDNEKTINEELDDFLTELLL